MKPEAPVTRMCIAGGTPSRGCALAEYTPPDRRSGWSHPGDRAPSAGIWIGRGPMGFLSKLFGGGKGSSSDGDPQAAIEQLVTLYDVPDVKADGGSPSDEDPLPPPKSLL